MREIQFRGHAELHREGFRARQDGVEFACDLQHGLAAEVLQREIDQVEVDPLQQQAGGRGDALLRLRLQPQRLAEGGVTRPFEELPDGLDAA